MSNWWKLTIKSDNQQDLEDLAFELFEFNAKGTEIQNANLIAFFEELKDKKAITNLLNQYQITNFSFEKESAFDWVKKCREYYTPLEIKGLKIIPILSKEEKKQGNPESIFIIPGMGFGSGHHPTTEMILEKIQTEKIKNLSLKNVLDFGTGSGILSVAIAILYKSKIISIDNDPQALINAKENLELNKQENHVDFYDSIEKFIEKYTPIQKFDLILANIYLSVLKQYENTLSKLISNNGILILSGITEDQEAELLNHYYSWDIISKNKKDGWCSYEMCLK